VKDKEFTTYSTTNLNIKSVFVSVLIRHTSSLIQPSSSTNMYIHRPQRTQVYNTVVVTFKYRGSLDFWPPVNVLHLWHVYISSLCIYKK